MWACHRKCAEAALSSSGDTIDNRGARSSPGPPVAFTVQWNRPDRSMRSLLQKTGWLLPAILALMGATSGSAAWAAAPELTNFHHTMWTSQDGLGAVFDIQQAADGYLWLTTSTGVFRFDGVRFQSVEEATNGAVPNSEIHAVFLSASGGVWLKTRAAGLLFWKDGRLTTFTDRRCTPVLQMEGIAEDRDGSLWLQASGGLFRMRGSVCEQIGPEHGYPGGFPAAILVDREGYVWVRTLGGTILFLAPGQSEFQRNCIRRRRRPLPPSFSLRLRIIPFSMRPRMAPFGYPTIMASAG